jgi:transcriptional regulator with XRE-family HTH domain
MYKFWSMKIHPKTTTVEELQMYLASRVRKSRLVKGYSQTDLSMYSMVSYSSLRKFEQTGEISLTSFLRIADALDESIQFENLFPRAEFYQLHSSGLLKRPKRCKNGTYCSSRIPSQSELEKYLDFEDDPTSCNQSATKRNWKKLKQPPIEKKWDPFEELKAIMNENPEPREP